MYQISGNWTLAQWSSPTPGQCVGLNPCWYVGLQRHVFDTQCVILFFLPPSVCISFCYKDGERNIHVNKYLYL